MQLYLSSAQRLYKKKDLQLLRKSPQNSFNETVLYAIILMSTFFSILFLGGYLFPTFGLISYNTIIWLQPIILGLKTSLILFIFIWVSLAHRIPKEFWI